MLKLLKLLPPVYRKQTIRVVLSVLLRAVLNFAGLAAMLPLLYLILGASEQQEYSLLHVWQAKLGIAAEDTFVWIIVGGILLFMLLKNMVAIWLGGVQNKYVMDLYAYFSVRLYDAYFRRGLLFVKQSHTTALAHKINGVCYTFAQQVLSLFFTMAGEAVLLLLIWSFLFFYTWQLAVFMLLCLLPALWLYFRTVKHQLNRNGKAENEVRRQQARTVGETFRGYAEVKLNRAYPLFRERFMEGLKKMAYYRRKTDRVLRVPSAIIEVAVCLGMITLVLIGRGDASVRLLFGVFAVAALRMLPAMRSLITGWAQLKNNAYTIDIIKEAAEHKAAAEPLQDSPRITHFREELAVEDLNFCFPDEDTPVINNLSFHVRKGERIGIKGASGIGKSTLFNLLLGLYAPQSGGILIDGKRLDAANSASWQALVGYVPQEVFVMHGTLAENVAFGVEEKAIDYRRVKDVLAQVQLNDFADSLPEGLHTLLGESGSRLSGGQRQRVGIARALYKGAEVLFFDEATSSLDTATEQEIRDSIDYLSSNNQSLTLLIIAHRPSSLASCNRIIEL
ncbi:MAG: ABC transporter ATP-binding protein/permease [Bacteroidales bacterium]|nr:ABC transporter ATP-binding protein/permease [Bacteroidales bacterium]MCL2133643.1 ABC transporter ATP-binding protein/permease [Bacteroidales bacterium]